MYLNDLYDGMLIKYYIMAVDSEGIIQTYPNNAPDDYMQKIAIGPGCPDNLISLEEDPEKNVTELSKALNKPIEQITVCVLDRPRHDNLIESLRSVGAKVRLIQDGDIAGVIHTTEKSTGIDMYMVIGGAP